LDEAAEYRGVGAAQLLGHGQLPLVEFGAVAQREAAQEVVAVEGDGGLHLRQSFNGRGAGVPGALRGRDGGLKDGYVTPDVIVIQTQAVAGDVERLFADGSAQGGQRAAQGSPGPLVIHLRPEQGGQRVAGLESAGDGQMGQQRHRLARVGFDGAAVAFEARGTKEEETKCHIDRPNSIRNQHFVTLFVTIRRR